MNIDTFSPLFSSVVLSSLWAEEDWVIKIFLTMVALQNREHKVTLGVFELAHLARKTEEEVRRALKVLSEPDRRKEAPQEFEGRRIQPCEDGGWFILNGEKYQDKMRDIFRRSRNAERMRQIRAGERTPRGKRRPGKAYMDREERYVRAADAGDQAAADAVAAEGLPQVEPSAQEGSQAADEPTAQPLRSLSEAPTEEEGAR